MFDRHKAKKGVLACSRPVPDLFQEGLSSEPKRSLARSRPSLSTSLVCNCLTTNHQSRKPLLLLTVALVSASISLANHLSVARLLQLIASEPLRRQLRKDTTAHLTQSFLPPCPVIVVRFLVIIFGVGHLLLVAAVSIKPVVVANSRLNTAHLLISRPHIICDTAYLHNQT